MNGIPAWASAYVGLPFAEQLQHGVDCWRLVQLVYRQRAGIELPDYGAVKASDLSAVAREMTRGRVTAPWVAVICPRELDVALMAGYAPDPAGKTYRAPVHVGVMLSPSHVLHVERGTDSVAVPVTHPSVARRILGYYRHEEIA